MKEIKRKSLKEMWPDIEIPVAVLVVWNAVVLFLGVDKMFSNKLFFSIIGWVISLAAFGYIGYSLARKKRGKEAVRTGAYAGAVAGFAGAILSIIAYYLVPGIFNAQIVEAVKAGAEEGTVRLFLQISLFFGLVFAPVVNGLIGALGSFIGSKIRK